MFYSLKTGLGNSFGSFHKEIACQNILSLISKDSIPTSDRTDQNVKTANGSFLALDKNKCDRFSLEVPWKGMSIEYPQHYVFVKKYEKNY